MKKCAKIICAYFGARRDSMFFNTPNNMVDYLKKMIENEINIENEYETDVIIVNNDIGEIEKNNFLKSYDGVKTKNGEIKIVERKNILGSFGAYYETVLNQKDEYDYWFFCEDDVLIFKNGYIKEFIDVFNSDPKIGFVSLAPFSDNKKLPIHSGGGIGLTSTERFLEVNTKEKIQRDLTRNRRSPSYEILQDFEIEFTNVYIRSGYKLVHHPRYSPLCENYSNHWGQSMISKKILDEGEKEFIYMVGN